MIRAMLALVMLNGISLIFWGCVGMCRFIHEQARRLDLSAVARALVPLITGLVGVTLLVLPLKLFLWIAAVIADYLWLTPSATASALAAAVLAGVLLCGIATSYVSVQLMGISHVPGVIVLSAGLYWLAAASLVRGSQVEGISSGWQEVATWLLPALALLSSSAGVLLARPRARALAAPRHADPPAARARLVADDVAVIIAAHNEEQTIEHCLDAASRCVAMDHVFVGSDGSTDRTVEIAAGRGCNVLDIQPNGGKARALRTVIEHFRICDRYAVALILDADAQPRADYLEHALPLFDDPKVAAVAGHATPEWHGHWLPRPSMLCVAYRVRLYRVTQALLRYGQTWKYSNVSFIVPGFASMYRTSVLRSIDIDAPGLIIEDFNMTFELHHKRLGRIAYSPRVRSTSHEPLNLRDYVKQVRRWYLGFWQTVRRHGFWPSMFWLSLGTFAVEMLLQSFAFLLVPLLLVWFTLGPGEPITLWLPQLGEADITALDLWLGVFLADYSTTAIISAVERKPILLLYGPGFALLRWIDAFLFIYTLPLAFAVKSDGRWVSPRRER